MDRGLDAPVIKPDETTALGEGYALISRGRFVDADGNDDFRAAASTNPNTFRALRKRNLCTALPAAAGCPSMFQPRILVVVGRLSRI